MRPGERLELDHWATLWEQQINFSWAFFFDFTSVKAAIHISVCNPHVCMCDRFVSPRSHFGVCMNHCGNDCTCLCEWLLLLWVRHWLCQKTDTWEYYYYYSDRQANFVKLSCEPPVQGKECNTSPGSFQGVAERLMGGAQVKLIKGGHCGMIEILMHYWAVCVQWKHPAPTFRLPPPPVNLCSLCCRPTPYSFSPLPTATFPSLPRGWNLLSHASLLPDANLTTTCV